MSSSNNSSSSAPASGRRSGGGGRRRTSGGADRRNTSGKQQQQHQRNSRAPRASEASMDSQMIDYWAKSEDPAMREKAAKMRLEHKALLDKQRQEKLDKEMVEYWKRQKVEGEESAPAAAAETKTEVAKTE